MNKEFLQVQEILRRCFENKTNTIKAKSWGSTQDYFNAVYDENEDAIRVNFAGTGAGFLYWLGAFESVDDLPDPGPSASSARRGCCALVMDESTDSAAIYWYDGDEWRILTTGGGGSNITVKDEGVTVVSNVETLNFIGTGVRAEGNGSVANIYIPPIDYASHFNTNDGSGDCRVPDVSTSSRNVAGPTSEGTPFKIDSWVEGTAHPVTRTTSLSYTSTNQCSFYDNTTTTIEVNVYDANGTSIIAFHTTTAITGNYDQTSNNIRIRVTSFEAEGGRYKGIITVDVNIAAILPNSGRFSIEIVHHDAVDGDFTKSQNGVFFDSEPNAQTISGVAVSETVGQTVIVRKSGVYEYGLGSKFTGGIADLDYLNSDSYPTTFVQMTGSEFGMPTLNLQGSNLSGWNEKYNNVNASYQNSLWQITSTNFFVRTTSAKVRARTIDWVSGAWVYSTGTSLIIDTYVDDSTRIYEDFTGESKRLESDYNTVWDSTLSLLTADGGYGLQVGEGSYLMYPKINYSIYDPNMSSQFNYSTATGTRYYYRKMWHTGISHSNGLFNILGVTESDITNDNVVIEVSLNGVDWYNCNEDYVGGPMSDGSGCRINVDSQTMPNMEFTLGTGNFTDATTGGGWGIFIRISMPATSNVQMDKIEIVNWA